MPTTLAPRRRGDPPVAVLLLTIAVMTGCRSAAIDPAAIDDAQTAARVKTALVNDAVLGGHAIEVRVMLGVVTLSGRVFGQTEVDRAVALARSVAGVTDVRSLLQLGDDDATVDEPTPPIVDDLLEFDPGPGLLAVGASIGFSDPRAGTLEPRVSLGPLVRLGSGQGLGPAVGFDWFQADLRSGAGSSAVLSRVHVRPVMVGASYTFASERVSVSPSLVGGVAFNSLSITQTGVATPSVPVEVGNSLVWRPGVSVWVDMGRRAALNVSAGYLMTGLRVTVLEDGRLEKRRTRGDTMVVHAGVAYKLF
jgi:hypothetical protein